MNGLSAHGGDEPGVRLDFEEIALADVKHKRWDGIHGAFHVELGADYELARGGWIRDNLTSKLELESGRHYHVRFERGLTGQLIVKFVPTKLVPDGNRSASKLAAMLHKLEKEIPPETKLRLEDVTVTPKDDCFEFSCKFDRSLHPDTITARVLLTAIINGSLETYAG